MQHERRKKGTSKRVRMQVGVIVLIVALAASVAASGRSPRTHAKLSGNLTLTIFNFSAPVIKPVLAAWEKQNPGVKVSFNIKTTDKTYQVGLQTAKVAHNLPDILETYDTLTPTLETDGLLTNLKPFLAKGQPYKQNYWLPGFMASYIPPAGKLKGQIFALPNEADATVMYLNKNEFKKAGVALPKNGWTWTQFLATAKKLTIGQGKKTTQWGMCLRPDWQALYNPMLKAYGVTAFTATKANLASPGALKAWSLMIQPETAGIDIPFATQQSQGGQCDPFFNSGQAAMSTGVRGDLPTIKAAAKGKFDFDVVTMPSVSPAGKATLPTGGGSVGWCLSSQVKNSANAIAFLKYLFSPAGQLVAEKTYGVVPALPSLLGANAAWRKLPAPPANNAAFTLAAKSATIAPQTPGTVYNLTQSAIPAAIEKVIAGTSVKDAFTELQKNIAAAYAAATKSR